MAMQEITITIAFLAGVVSFVSPCVLPLIPSFIAYLAGTTLEKAGLKRKEVFLNSLFFVIGFSIVFAILGVLLNTVLEAIAYDVQDWLARIGGALIIFFGFYLTGIIKIPFLDKEYKLGVKQKFSSRYLTSLLFGAAFAAGWTPCVGAVLGSVLGLAAAQPGSAFVMLLTYSIGLGLPFLVVGLFTSQAADFIKKNAGLLKYFTIVFGVLLIALGVLVFTRSLNLIANFDLLNRLLLQ